MEKEKIEPVDVCCFTFGQRAKNIDPLTSGRTTTIEVGTPTIPATAQNSQLVIKNGKMFRIVNGKEMPMKVPAKTAEKKLKEKGIKTKVLADKVDREEK